MNIQQGNMFLVIFIGLGYLSHLSGGMPVLDTNHESSWGDRKVI